MTATQPKPESEPSDIISHRHQDQITKLIMRHGGALYDMLADQPEARKTLRALAQAIEDKLVDYDRQKSQHIGMLMEAIRQRNHAYDRIDHLEQLLDELAREIDGEEPAK